MPPLAALFLALLLNACWPLIGQDGLAYFSAPLFFYGGLAVGSLVVFPTLAAKGRWRRMLSREVALPLALMGWLSGTASIIYLSALRYTTPANAAVMAQVEVLYSAVLSAWFLREAIGLSQVAASFLVVAGTGLILAHDLGSWRWKGDLMIALTPWMYQLSHIFAKRLPKDLDPLLVTGSRLFYGLLLLSPYVLWTLGHAPRWSWSAPALRILALQGLLMGALSLWMWYSAILRMDLAKATAVLLSYPALTMLFSWALGRERIHPVQVAGLAVTLGGAYWLSRIAMGPGPSPPQAEGSRPSFPEGPRTAGAAGQD